MSSAYLLFEGEDLKRQAELFGADPYVLGLSANRRMLEIPARSSFEQGLTRERLEGCVAMIAERLS